MTPSQERMLLKWLQKRIEDGTDNVVVYSNKSQKMYSLIEEDERSIIKKIKKSFSTGFLEKKRIIRSKLLDRY